MPEAVDPGIASGFQAADQQSYLQQVLANTRATQQQAAQLKAKQEEQVFDPESLNGPDVAPDEFARRKAEIGGFASGATKGPDGRDRFIFRSGQDRDKALEFTKSKTGERQTVTGDKAAASAFRQRAMQDPKMLDANGKLRPEAERHLQVLEGGNPLDPNRAAARKTIQEWNDYHATVGKGGLMVDQRGGPLGSNTPPRPETLKASDDDHKIVRRQDASGEVSYSEEPKKGADYLNEAIALVEQGVPQTDPRIVRLLTKANYGRASFIPEGAAPFNASAYNLDKIRPAGAPPAGVAPAAGQVSGQGAVEGGAQAAAWLREKAKDPNLSAEDRQTLLKSAAATDKVEQAGKAQKDAAAPASARPPGVGEVINKKPTESSQITKAQGFQAAVNSIDQVRKYLDVPEVSAFRGDQGMLSAIRARAGAKIQDYTHISMGVPQTALAARAALVTAQGEWRRSLAGVAVTPTESEFLQNVVTTDISDPALPAKINELERMMHKYWREIEAASVAQQRTGIPAAGPSRDQTAPVKPTAPAKPAGSAPAQGSKTWTRDANGKLVPAQ